jgi:hypothetical protein
MGVARETKPDVAHRVRPSLEPAAQHAQEEKKDWDGHADYLAETVFRLQASPTIAVATLPLTE